MNENEKREFCEIAQKIIYLSAKSRREGLLAIEEDLDTISVPGEKNTLFLKKLLSLVVNGVDASIVRWIGEKYISVDPETAFDETCFNAIFDGVLSIQMGDNPMILAEKLGAYLGILNSAEFISEMQSKTGVELVFGKISSGGTISADEIDEFLNAENKKSDEDTRKLSFPRNRPQLECRE
ncbi:MAG: hypothetical protein IKP49_03650 [Treponema sp.]|nr:hypothetical protein [Treponema sp.]